MDFKTLDKNALSSKDKLGEYLKIVQLSKTDPIFRSTIDIERFINISASLAIKLEYPGIKIAIVGFPVPEVGEWDPFTCETGLPGSEEAVVYLSDELSKMGHKVDIYMNPSEKSIWKSALSNPRWFHADEWFQYDSQYNLAIIWRNYRVDIGKLRADYVFFWSHDRVRMKDAIFPDFDGVCMLSKHHYNQYCSALINFNKVPYTICGNGVVLEQFNKPMSFENPFSVGYFSNYSQGLNLLIAIWPQLKQEFPKLTLDIYYGRQHWDTMPQDKFKSLCDKIEEYKSLGVTEVGKVGHRELALAMQKLSIWAYPCYLLGETFAITAVKAQLAGMIPITTRITALNETVHTDAPGVPKITNEIEFNNYYQVMRKTLIKIRDNPDEINIERIKYIEFAKQFTWSRTANSILELYNKIII